MPIRLCRWGNSTGLRLPKSVLEMVGLAAGGYVSLRVLDNGDIRLRPVVLRVPVEICNKEYESALKEDGETNWSEMW